MRIPTSPSVCRQFIQQNKIDFPASETAKLYAGRVEYTLRDFGKIDRITKAMDDVLEYEDILTGESNHQIMDFYYQISCKYVYC